MTLRSLSSWTSPGYGGAPPSHQFWVRGLTSLWVRCDPPLHNQVQQIHDTGRHLFALLFISYTVSNTFSLIFHFYQRSDSIATNWKIWQLDKAATSTAKSLATYKDISFQFQTCVKIKNTEWKIWSLWSTKIGYYFEKKSFDDHLIYEH